MSKMTRGLISKILLDGAYRQIPGLELNPAVGSYGVPFMIASGKLDLVTAVAEQAPYYFPFRAKLLAAQIRVRTQLGTGAGIVGLGKFGAGASATYFASNTVPITDVAGTVRIVTLTQSLAVPGDVFYFNGDGGATTTGDVDVWTVWVPWLGA